MSSPAQLAAIWAEFTQTRSQALRRVLIEAYAPLVKITVDRLGMPPRSIIEAEDLISYGLVGLINAIDRYDPTRGVSFETFAVARIRGAVIDQLRALNWCSRTALARIKRAEQTVAELEKRLGRPPRDQEIAAALGLSLKRYRRLLMEMGAVILSLDRPLSGGSAGERDHETLSLGEALEDQNAPEPAREAERQELIRLLREAIEQLPRRERLLLALYYVEGLTMSEIARVMDLSQSRVSQLHAQTLLRLRASIGAYDHPSPRSEQLRSPHLLSRR